jgi:CRISPR-associated protein Cas2
MSVPMRILLIYDIVDDRRRTKIADACLDYGLDRVQMSAFTGLLNRSHQEELMLRIDTVLGDSEGKIHLYPIDQKAWERRLELDTMRTADEEDVDDDIDPDNDG